MYTVDDIPEEKISLGSKRPSDRESHIDAKVVKQSDNSHTRSIVQKVKISPSRGNERPRGDNTEKVLSRLHAHVASQFFFIASKYQGSRFKMSDTSTKGRCCQ